MRSLISVVALATALAAVPVAAQTKPAIKATGVKPTAAEADAFVAEAAATDDLTKTVNYAEVGDLVAGFIMGEPFDLIETLADRIAGTILQTQPLAEAVEVTVHKPQAPLPHEFHDVQVTVVRDRADLATAARSGELVVPRGISISSSLIESWFGGPVDGPGWD